MKNNYSLVLQRKVEAEREKSRIMSRQFTLDAVTLALAELGFTDFEKFRDMFEQIEYEIACKVTNEAKEERENHYKMRGLFDSKDKVDRALKDAVGEELFVPWEERYNI